MDFHDTPCSIPFAHTPHDDCNGKPGLKRPRGRPKAGTVKLTAHILPATRAALGKEPGKAIDRLVAAAK